MCIEIPCDVVKSLINVYQLSFDEFTFEDDKDMLAEIINGVTGIPKEDIIERGILLDSQDLINPEKVKKYKDSDILISVYNNTINIVMNKKDQK